MRPTKNKLWFDRRVAKPRWLCVISGGYGYNSTNIQAKAYGCCRPIAFVRALRAWRKAVKLLNKGK
jgi:hypothetical protein